MDYLITYEDEFGLQHHGVLGMKWGVRRYQNPDGTLTDLGRKRLGYSYRDKATNKSNALAGIRSDIAAAKNAKHKVRLSIADGSTSIMDTTGRKAVKYQARAEAYNDIADRRAKKEDQTKREWNTTIAIKSTAANNQRKADVYKSEAADETKGMKVAKSLFEGLSGYTLNSSNTKQYSAVGREYVVKDEMIANFFTQGLYSVIKDAKYSKQYSAEERFNRIK